MGRAHSGYGTSVDQAYQDPNNRRKDRGNCEVDARHVFNFTSVTETPKFANPTVNMLGSGWRLSVLYRAYTGAINAANASSGQRTVTLGSASAGQRGNVRSEEHTSELQSHSDLVCRLLLEKKNKKKI